MSIQKAKSSSPNFNNLDPYHPNDINYVNNPEEHITDYRPEPVFSYTKVYPTSGDLPTPSTGSGTICFVVGNPEGYRQVYSNGSGWLPLIQ